MKANIIFGTQLFAAHPAVTDDAPIIMIESEAVCRALPYHQQKLIFVLSSMRHYGEWLRDQGKEVWYIELQERPINDVLADLVTQRGITHLGYMQPSTKGQRRSMQAFCASRELASTVYPTQLFVTDDDTFRDWFVAQKSPVMEQFYRQQRRRLGILIEPDGSPVGGSWNYDHDNRQALLKSHRGIPQLPIPDPDQITRDVTTLVRRHFPDHPGAGTEPWLPVTFQDARSALQRFVNERFGLFGRYEDAMKSGESFLYHSVLSPLINIGLLTVDEVLQAVLAADVPLASKEGFVRQLIGWREYMNGLYWNVDWTGRNYFGFDRQLEDWWYTDDWQSAPLPDAVKHALSSTHRYGYNHHIERLMVLGNWFLLNEYDPWSVNRWFSSMYVDAYEWVMLPNVIGMSQYADGGIVATKPYIAGDAYLKRMGHFAPSSDPALQFTTHYWSFLARNHDKLQDNWRLKPILNQARKRAG